jgi:type IV secretory pathway VirB9-like protein
MNWCISDKIQIVLLGNAIIKEIERSLNELVLKPLEKKKH